MNLHERPPGIEEVPSTNGREATVCQEPRFQPATAVFAVSEGPCDASNARDEASNAANEASNGSNEASNVADEASNASDSAECSSRYPAGKQPSHTPEES